MKTIDPSAAKSRSIPFWAIALLIALPLGLPLGGCRICADCEDLDYPAYGGAWQRTLRNSGRVGSVFDPGGAKAGNLVDRTAPEEPDQIERNRQESQSQDPDMTDPGEIDSPDRGNPDDGRDEGSMRDREDRLRNRGLDDIESDGEDELRRKGLDDIEVRIIPGRRPVMVNSSN